MQEVMVRDGQSVRRGETLMILGDVGIAADDNRLSVCEPVQQIASPVMQSRASVLAPAENLATIFNPAERTVGSTRRRGGL